MLLQIPRFNFQTPRNTDCQNPPVALQKYQRREELGSLLMRQRVSPVIRGADLLIAIFPIGNCTGGSSGIIYQCVSWFLLR